MYTSVSPATVYNRKEWLQAGERTSLVWLTDDGIIGTTLHSLYFVLTL